MDNVSKPTVLSIMSERCGHCVRFKPTFTEVAEEINARGDATALAISADYANQGVPTTIIWRGDGSSPVVLPGNRPKEMLKSAIDRVLGGGELSPRTLSGGKTAKLEAVMDTVREAIFENTHREAFHPDNARISHIGWKHVEGGLADGGNDVMLYMMLVNDAAPETPMMAVHGSVRGGEVPLSVEVFTDTLSGMQHMQKASEFVRPSQFMTNALQTALRYRLLDDQEVPSLSSLI